MLPIVLCIDVEPDERLTDPDRPSAWRGFERAVPFIRRFRQDRAGVSADHVSWFFRLDPQVRDTYGRADWLLHEHRETLAALEAAGDEMGVHTHAYRWNHARRDWLTDHGTQEWVERCLETSFDAFAGHFGRPVRTFRFGDRWMNAATMAWLARAGVAYDLTVEPGHGPQPTYDPAHDFTGFLPDYTNAPHAPYRPAAGDVARAAPGGDGLLELPLTTAPVRRTWLRRVHDRVRGLPASHVTTALISHVPATFRRIVDHALARESTRHLGLVVRTGVFAEPRFVRRVEVNLRMLREHPRAREFRWVTPAEAVSMLPGG